MSDSDLKRIEPPQASSEARQAL